MTTPTPAPVPSCFVCGTTENLRVAYAYWPEDQPPSAGKLTKYLCAGGAGACVPRIDAQYAAGVVAS